MTRGCRLPHARRMRGSSIAQSSITGASLFPHLERPSTESVDQHQIGIRDVGLGPEKPTVIGTESQHTPAGVHLPVEQSHLTDAAAKPPELHRLRGAGYGRRGEVDEVDALPAQGPASEGH